MSKTCLAERVAVSLRTISAYESGAHVPPSETAERLAKVLNFGVAFFFGEDLHEPSEEAANFRRLARMTAATRDAALASGSLAMLFHDWLKARFALPSPSVPDYREEDPETAAMELRNEWELGEKPVRNMVHLLESKGVCVFSMSETPDVDAFSLWRESTPFIFLNTIKSAEHSRFDAAHELGHLVLHQQVETNGKKAESEANRFASAFLMPRGSVLAKAPVLPSLRILIQLKKQWIVSVAALAHRLHSLNLIKDWHYRQLCIAMSQYGYRKSEPEGAPREMSLVFGKVFHMLRREGLSKNNAAADLKLNVEDLNQALFGLVVTDLKGGGQRDGRAPNGRSIRIVK